jgi:alpha-aminoadipate carrier protein LysW
MVKCPECNAAIDVDEGDLDEGDELVCEECGAELRVAGVDPLELEEVEDDEEEDEEADLDEDGEDERWR